MFVTLGAENGDYKMGEEYLACRWVVEGRSGIGGAFVVGDDPAVCSG